MSTPTPDEITAAHDTLRRMPYVRPDTTLAEIKAANTPLWWMVRDVLGQLDSDRLPNPGELASILATSAAAHGLRITTDPERGELIGHFSVFGGEGDWLVEHRRPGSLTEATETAHSRFGRRVAALYLLPEGGKA